MKTQTTDKPAMQRNLEILLDGFSNYEILASARNKKLAQHEFEQNKANFVVTITSFHPDVTEKVIDGVCHTLIKKFKSQEKELTACDLPGTYNEASAEDETLVARRDALRFTKNLLKDTMGDLVESKSPVISKDTIAFLNDRLQRKDLV